MSTHINYLYPKKRGRLVKTRENRLIFVNEGGKAFSTNDALIVTWQLCLGDKSVDQICQNLKRHYTTDLSVVNKNIVHLIQKLQSVDLLYFGNNCNKNV